MVDVRELCGQKIGDCQLDVCLGHGTHTAVYRATGSFGAQWALKVIDRQIEPEPAFLERLRREAELRSRVDHPAIPMLREVAGDDDLTYATTPFVEAPTLFELMANGGVDADLLWNVVSQLADALQRSHDVGLVCRSLKPNNILVEPSGKAILAEFGLASRRTGPLALTSPGYHLRAPQYLAPEQVEGKEPSRRSDVYAIGVLIFEVLTETPLLSGRTAGEILAATLNSPAPLASSRNRRLPPGVDRVLATALAKDPGDRQNSVWDLLEDLIAVPDMDRPRPAPPRRTPAPHRPAAVRAAPPPAPAPAVVPMPTPPPPLAPVLPPAPPPQVAGGAPAFPTYDPALAAQGYAVPVAEEASAAPAPIPPDSAVSTLHRMGVPSLESHDLPLLNEYFACLMRHAREVSESRWPQVLDAGGLNRYLVEAPPDNGDRTITAEECSRLVEGFEAVFGAGSPALLRTLGRSVTEDWLRSTQPRPFRMLGKVENKVADTLQVFNHSMDRVRGEPLHAWKQVDRRQFWVIHYANLFALGRIRSTKSCHLWVAAFEAALRWGGLPSEWEVAETECGCVTGTFCCVFSIDRIAS